MKINNNNKHIIRRVIFALFIVFTAVFQSTKGMVLENRVSAMVFIPLTVCIAMHEKSVPALLFGIFSGILWDGMSITVDGYFTMVLGAASFFVSLISLFFMRNNIVSALILSFGATLFSNTWYWLNFVLMKGYDGALYIYLRYYLPAVLTTMIFVPVYYYAVKFICEKTAPERKRVNY